MVQKNYKRAMQHSWDSKVSKENKAEFMEAPAPAIHSANTDMRECVSAEV